MGYYPKHLKVRRYRWNQRVIATAVLSGAVIVRRLVPRAEFRHGNTALYTIHYDDGQQSHYCRTRGEAAALYLIWYFDKMDIWPKKWRAL